MSAPIAHIVFSECYLKQNKSSKLNLFILGTSFPDIRYIADIDRGITHLEKVSISDVTSTKDQFLAGFKFHSFVDLNRERYLQKQDIYKDMPKSKYIHAAMKLVEDKYLYDYIKDWDKYYEYFNNIVKQELEYGCSEGIINKWHSIIQKYIMEKPKNESYVRFMQNIGLEPNIVAEVTEIINKVESNTKHKQIIQGYYTNLEKILNVINKP